MADERQPTSYAGIVAGYSHLQAADPVVFALAEREAARQDLTLRMTPSENYVSLAVMQALATPFMNNYAEGHPDGRYYQGQEGNNAIENLAMERARELFGVPYVNVQPLSGSPANAAVEFAMTNYQDTVMGLSLKSGGHLTHGVPDITFSGRWGKSVQYEVGEDGLIDYDAFERQAIDAKPKMIIVGITSHPREINYKRLAEIAKAAGDAILVADISHTAGLVVGGAHHNPAEHVHIITTTTHKTLRGPRGAIIAVTNKGLEKDPEMDKKVRMAVFPGMQGGPHMETIAAMAVAFEEASQPQFREYAHQTVANAQTLADEMMNKGYKLVTGGTDNHLMVVDLQKEGILGNTVAEGLEAAGIVLNRNAVPNDPNPPFYPSGYRMGTPALTSRGMKEDQMKQIAGWIDDVTKALLEAKSSLSAERIQAGEADVNERKKVERNAIIAKAAPAIQAIKEQVEALCRQYPIPLAY